MRGWVGGEGGGSLSEVTLLVSVAGAKAGETLRTRYMKNMNDCE